MHFCYSIKKNASAGRSGSMLEIKKEIVNTPALMFVFGLRKAFSIDAHLT